jgi:hypothetical protein
VRSVGVTCAVRLRLPVKPLKLASVSVDVPDDPTDMDREVGLAVMLKSMMFTATVTDRVKLPLVPLTTTA